MKPPVEATGRTGETLTGSGVEVLNQCLVNQKPCLEWRTIAAEMQGGQV